MTRKIDPQNIYATLDPQTFNGLIQDEVRQLGLAGVLTLPGVMAIVQDELNNDALESADSIEAVNGLTFGDIKSLIEDLNNEDFEEGPAVVPTSRGYVELHGDGTVVAHGQQLCQIGG